MFTLKTQRCKQYRKRDHLKNHRGVSTAEVLILTAALLSVALIFKGDVMGFVGRSMPELFGNPTTPTREGIFVELVGGPQQSTLPIPPGYEPKKQQDTGLQGAYALNFKPVYMSQEDPTWSKTPYTITGNSKQTIGTSGCGPTAMTMAVNSITEANITPDVLCNYAIDIGARTVNSGTSWTFFGKAARKYHLECIQTGNFDVVKAALGDGNHVAVATMRPTHFTKQGHYVTLLGIAGRNGEDWVMVYDPNQDNKSYGADQRIGQGNKDDGMVEVKEALLKKEAAQYWILSKEVGGSI